MVYLFAPDSFPLFTLTSWLFHSQPLTTAYLLPIPSLNFLAPFLSVALPLIFLLVSFSFDPAVASHHQSLALLFIFLSLRFLSNPRCSMSLGLVLVHLNVSSAAMCISLFLYLHYHMCPSQIKLKWRSPFCAAFPTSSMKIKN